MFNASLMAFILTWCGVWICRWGVGGRWKWELVGYGDFYLSCCLPLALFLVFIYCYQSGQSSVDRLRFQRLAQDASVEFLKAPAGSTVAFLKCHVFTSGVNWYICTDSRILQWYVQLSTVDSCGSQFNMHNFVIKAYYITRIGSHLGTFRTEKLPTLFGHESLIVSKFCVKLKPANEWNTAPSRNMPCLLLDEFFQSLAYRVTGSIALTLGTKALCSNTVLIIRIAFS